MENNILKIDLDLSFQFKALDLLKKRLSYMHDVGFLDVNNIDNIQLLYKTKYSCKIKLNIELREEFIIITQLLLGSDPLKEINTCINHFRLNMKYSNRMFTVKRYYNGKIRFARVTDITDEIKNYILDKNRKKNYT